LKRASDKTAPEGAPPVTAPSYRTETRPLKVHLCLLCVALPSHSNYRWCVWQNEYVLYERDKTACRKNSAGEPEALAADLRNRTSFVRARLGTLRRKVLRRRTQGRRLIDCCGPWMVKDGHVGCVVVSRARAGRQAQAPPCSGSCVRRDMSEDPRLLDLQRLRLRLRSDPIRSVPSSRSISRSWTREAKHFIGRSLTVGQLRRRHA
jgi:hypothetical protein